MSGFKRFFKDQIITNQPMASSGVVLSSIQDITRYDNVGIELIWTAGVDTGLPTGSFSIDACIDANVPTVVSSSGAASSGFVNALVLNPGTMVRYIPSSSLSMVGGFSRQPAASTGAMLVRIDQSPFPFIQIRYTPTSGTGTLNAWISGKQI